MKIVKLLLRCAAYMKELVFEANKIMESVKYNTEEQLKMAMSSSSSSNFVKSPRNSSKRTRIDSNLEQQSESTIERLKLIKLTTTHFLKNVAVLRDEITDKCACSILNMLTVQITKDMPDIYAAFDSNFGKGSLWKLKDVNTGIQILMAISSSSSSSSSLTVEITPPLSYATVIAEFFKHITDNYLYIVC